MAPWLNWIEYRPSKPVVRVRSPVGSERTLRVHSGPKDPVTQLVRV